MAILAAWARRWDRSSGVTIISVYAPISVVKDSAKTRGAIPYSAAIRDRPGSPDQRPGPPAAALLGSAPQSRVGRPKLLRRGHLARNSTERRASRPRTKSPGAPMRGRSVSAIDDFLKSWRPDSNRRRPASEEGRAATPRVHLRSFQSLGALLVSICAHERARLEAQRRCGARQRRHGGRRGRAHARARRPRAPRARTRPGQARRSPRAPAARVRLTPSRAGAGPRRVPGSEEPGERERLTPLRR